MNRDDVIVALLCQEEFDNGGAEVWLEKQKGILRIVRGGAVHDGDCTKRPYTCLRCLVEEYEKRADCFLVAMRGKKDGDPDPEMLKRGFMAWR